jgi:hypothetical protein
MKSLYNSACGKGAPQGYPQGYPPFPSARKRYRFARS